MAGRSRSRALRRRRLLLTHELPWELVRTVAPSMGPRIPSPWVNRRRGAEGISDSEPLASLPERQEEGTVLACSIHYLSTEMLASCAPRRPGLGFL